MKKLLLLLSLLSTFLVHASYEEHFPQYYEFCTGTQLKYQPEYFSGAEGGIGGHGFMYLHGLCKDYSKDYPQVIPCSETSDHKGVGITLDSDFVNVSWVAVPGRDFLLFGNTERKVISKEDIADVAKKASDLRIFENVKTRPDFVSQYKLNSAEHQKASAMWGIGTDIAINWARDLRCVKIPVSSKALEKAAKFLNDLNDKYYKTGLEYKWVQNGNNCAHFAMNTAHAMGISKGIKTDKGKVEQLFNLAVPSNAYMMFVDKTVLKNKPSLGKIARSETFKSLGYHPVQVGTLLSKYSVYPESVIFKVEELKGLTLPRKNIFKLLATPQKYDKHVAKEKYSVLEVDAGAWVKHYDKLLEKAEKRNKPDELIQYLKDQRDRAQRIVE